MSETIGFYILAKARLCANAVRISVSLYLFHTIPSNYGNVLKVYTLF